MARYYDPIGFACELHPSNGQAFSLDELRQIIGPAITIMHAPSGKYLVFNERGPDDHLPVNHAATLILGQALGANGFIAGSALLCERLEVADVC